MKRNHKFLGLLFLMFSLIGNSADSKNDYYLISDNSKLGWEKDVDLIPNFLPKQSGVWFEGSYKDKTEEKLFGVWVSRTNGKKNEMSQVQQSWNQIVLQNKNAQGKEITDLGCKKISKDKQICERNEKELIKKDGKNIYHYGNVKMIWNGKKDLIIMKLFSYTDAPLLSILNHKIQLKLDSPKK